MDIFLFPERYNRMDKIGYKAKEDRPYKYSQDRTYVEVPLHIMIKMASDEKVDKVKMGTRVRLVPGAELQIRETYKVQISANPELLKLGDVQYTSVLGAGDEENFVIYFRPYKDFDISMIKYLLRLYVHGE